MIAVSSYAVCAAALALHLAHSAAPARSRAELQALAVESAGNALPQALKVGGVQLSTVPRLTQEKVTAVVEWKRTPTAGRQTARVSFVQGGRTESVWAQIELRARRLVAVAARDLVAGEMLKDSDVAVSYAEVVAGTAAVSQVRGGRLLHDVEVGAILASKDVAAPPPVARGSDVIVKVKVGAVEVESVGKLEAAARPGDVTRVRIGTGRIVKGRLVDPQTVEVVGGQR